LKHTDLHNHEGAPVSRTISRRDFIIFVSTAAGALVASCRPAALDDAGVPTLVPGGFRPTPVPTTTSAPTKQALDVDFSAPDPQYSEIVFDDAIRITPVDRFYVQLWDDFPEPVSTADWTLTINGLVDHPMSLTYNEILAIEPVTVMRTLECIGNPPGGPLIGNTTWTGFRLKPLLEQVGIKPDAVRAKFAAADQYLTAVNLEWILHEDALLIYLMDGEPLTNEHGFPLRIMMPGLYGQKMPKWLYGIEFVDYPYEGYYEHHGWNDRAEVKTISKIVLPDNLAAISGSFVLQGWAYAGKRAITQVEVSIDDGPWQLCELLQERSPLVWTQWWIRWTPERAGTFRVTLRATDDTGFTQSMPGEGLSSSYPDGTDAMHSITLDAQKPTDSES
jgi:DMSO/TMAO reductase YedYZ molybdopterin-dependent catalytic subunit